MIRRTSKYFVMAAMVSFAAYANAGTAAVTPALAACSKALVETWPSPRRCRRTPSSHRAFSSRTSWTRTRSRCYAHHAKTKQLLAKASCKATPPGEIVSFKSIPLKS